MNFKEATDGLFNRISHEELAEALGVSVASIRQARLGRDAKAHREPPDGWREAAIRLAEGRVLHYRKLIERLK
jgi:DNA-binding GntR family transcriptional regulator